MTIWYEQSATASREERKRADREAREEWNKAVREQEEDEE